MQNMPHGKYKIIRNAIIKPRCAQRGFFNTRNKMGGRNGKDKREEIQKAANNERQNH
jgi:hypothetical protein